MSTKAPKAAPPVPGAAPKEMGKHDDDDGDEKAAWASNKRLSGGGAGKEAEDEDDGDALLNPVVKAFCHHVVSQKFREELDTFFDSGCDAFEEADPDGEHRLEWTEAHTKYVKKVESMLETFCGIHGLDPSAVFTMVQRACASGVLDDEFLPAILNVAEYRFFVEQMVLMAHEDRHHSRATRLGASSGGESKGDDTANLSGVWLLSTKDGNRQLTDVGKGLEKYLRAVGVPPSLHGLFRGTLFSKKGLVLLHEGDDLTLVFDTVTGRHKQVFVVDGQTRNIPTIGGTRTPYTVTSDDYGRVRVQSDRPSNLPKGARIVQTWQLLGKHLKCTAEVEKPSGVVCHEFFYRREAIKKTRKMQPAMAHK